MGQTHTNANCYWGMLIESKCCKRWAKEICAPCFPQQHPQSAPTSLLGTSNLGTHFTEHLQFAISVADCSLMFLPLGSGVLWIGCFFTFVLCLYCLTGPELSLVSVTLHFLSTVPVAHPCSDHHPVSATLQYSQLGKQRNIIFLLQSLLVLQSQL